MANALKLIRTQVGKAVVKAGLTLPAVLTKVTPGTRGATVSAGTNPTTTTYACRGLVSEYTEREIDGALVQVGDRKIVLIGRTLAIAPMPGDRVTIEGETYTIPKDGVSRDAASAAYTCVGRR